MLMSRRSFLAATGTTCLSVPLAGKAWADTPLLSVETRLLDVKGKPARVFGISGRNRRPGLFAEEGGIDSSVLFETQLLTL